MDSDAEKKKLTAPRTEGGRAGSTSKEKMRFAVLCVAAVAVLGPAQVLLRRRRAGWHVVFAAASAPRAAAM